MSIQSQIDRISGAVSNALAALAEKGVTAPVGTKVDGLASLIAAIEAGGGGTGGMTQGIMDLFSVSEEITVEHGLGLVPCFFMIALKAGDAASTSAPVTTVIYDATGLNTSGLCAYFKYGTAKFIAVENAVTISENSITINVGAKFRNMSWYWVAVA